MKAAVLTQKQQMEVQSVPVPEIGPNECLIKTGLTGICGTDLHIFEGHHPTAIMPLIQGHEFTGTIEALPANVETTFKVGDRVVAQPLISCGQCEACKTGNSHVCRRLKVLGVHANGSFAEYLKVPLEKVIPINPALPDEIAALTEPFAVGFHVTQRSGMRHGDSVLVIGAGPIGLITAMVAEIAGAGNVVLTEINPARVAMTQGFGFTVLNPNEVDLQTEFESMTGGAGFDVVFEASGSQPGLLQATAACRIRGTIVPVGFPSARPEFDVLQVILKELSVVGSRVYTLQDYERTVQMLDNIYNSARFDLSKLISGTCNLAEIPGVIDDIASGRSLGKILVNAHA